MNQPGLEKDEEKKLIFYEKINSKEIAKIWCNVTNGELECKRKIRIKI